jgi:transcriptional regulator with XRE-family HTH domain
MPRTASSQIAAKQLGEAVRETRRRAGLTQVVLAERLGVSAPYVANVEAGRQNVTLGQMANIAAALGAGLEIGFPLPTRERVVVPEPAR